MATIQVKDACMMVSMAKYQRLLRVAKAAYALHLLEDFEEMPCQHECCAPQDWDAYQFQRRELYDALMALELKKPAHT